MPGSIIDQDVDPSHCLKKLVEHAVYRALVGKIGGEENGRVPGVGTLDFIHGCLSAFSTPEVVDSDLGSFCCKPDGNRLTDP